MPPEQRRNAGLKFQTVLDGCNFEGDGGAETGSGVGEAARGGSAEFNDGGGFFIGRLREGGPEGETETRQQQRFGRIQS